MNIQNVALKRRIDFFLFSIWLIALVATLGSLFFSEVMNYPPCTLCWYQRICMYPLVFLFGLGIYQSDLSCLKFSFPQVIFGWGLALYHNLLYYKILPESAAPCRKGISCTSVHIEWLGFITIPLLSFISFTFIVAVTIYLLKVYYGKK